MNASDGFSSAAPMISITAPEPSTPITSSGDTGVLKTVSVKN